MPFGVRGAAARRSVVTLVLTTLALSGCALSGGAKKGADELLDAAGVSDDSALRSALGGSDLVISTSGFEVSKEWLREPAVGEAGCALVDFALRLGGSDVSESDLSTYAEDQLRGLHPNAAAQDAVADVAKLSTGDLRYLDNVTCYILSRRH